MKLNCQLLQQIYQAQQKRAVQDLIKAIIGADNQERDLYIDAQEMEELILRMKYLHGMNFDETRFREEVQAKSVGQGCDGKTSVEACVQVAFSMMKDGSKAPTFWGKSQIPDHLPVNLAAVTTTANLTLNNESETVAVTPLDASPESSRDINLKRKRRKKWLHIRSITAKEIELYEKETRSHTCYHEKGTVT